MSKISFWCCIIVALPAWLFDYFMYCTFVSQKISFCCSLIVALPSRVFDSFMYWPFVSNKTSLCSCFIVAFPAMVFDTIKYYFEVSPKCSGKQRTLSLTKQTPFDLVLEWTSWRWSCEECPWRFCSRKKLMKHLVL